jgi:hypothetical protein
MLHSSSSASRGHMHAQPAPQAGRVAVPLFMLRIHTIMEKGTTGVRLPSGMIRLISGIRYRHEGLVGSWDCEHVGSDLAGQCRPVDLMRPSKAGMRDHNGVLCFSLSSR